MQFLKINRFAGILAIACALLFPKIAFGAYGDVFIAKQGNVCKINTPDCDLLIYQNSTAGIAPVDDDEFYFIDSGNVIKHYNITTNTTTEFGNAFANTYQIAYRNGKLATLSSTNIHVTNVDSIDWDIVATGAYELGGIDFNTDGSGLFYHNTSNGLMYVEIGNEPQFFKTSTSQSFVKVAPSGNVYYYTDSYLYRVNENGGDSEQLVGVLFSNAFNFDINNEETTIYSSFNISGPFVVYERNLTTGDFVELYSSSDNAWGINVFKEFLPPPLPPASVIINGLTCSIQSIPDTTGITWNNDFMNNSGYSQWSEGGTTGLISYSGSIEESDFINIAYTNGTSTGSSINSGSLNYPGTGIMRLIGNDTSFDLLFSDSIVKPNIIELHGTSNISLGKSGIAQLKKGPGVYTSEQTLEADENGVTRIYTTENDKISIATISLLNQFNGMRYSLAPVVEKKACKFKYNICEWKYTDEGIQCTSGELVSGLPAGECEITSSGSIYGSGSCVPTTNEQGEIIPPVLVPGITIYDGNGDPIGNIYKPETQILPDFSCGFSDDDGWTDTIGKTIKCGVKFLENTFSISKNGIDTIQGTSQALGESVDINPITNTGTATGVLSNPLLAQLQDVDEGASEQKYVKMTFGIFVFFFTILLVAIIATVLKGGIKNSIKN